jgi:hypothetical protein
MRGMKDWGLSLMFQRNFGALLGAIVGRDSMQTWWTWGFIVGWDSMGTMMNLRVYGGLRFHGNHDELGGL